MPSASTEGLKITDENKENFDTLCRAIREGHAGLMVIKDTLTGREDIGIMAFSRMPDGQISFTPFAMLLGVHENPFQRLCPPDPKGGYHEPLTDKEVEEWAAPKKMLKSKKPTKGPKTPPAGTPAAGNPSCAGDALN